MIQQNMSKTYSRTFSLMPSLYLPCYLTYNFVHFEVGHICAISLTILENTPLIEHRFISSVFMLITRNNSTDF